MSVITVERKVLAKNDELAEHNRNLLKQNEIFTINLVSSPGSGKTSLLEKTFETLGSKIDISVIEGDVQTSLDAERVANYNVPVVSIVTNGACHLEAKLVQDALSNLDLEKTELLFIENVGNLVCPAGFDLGENMKIVLVSTTEGDDKPLKYPKMFRNSQVMIINKSDLIPYVNCNIETLKNNALNVNPGLKIFELSCTSGTGIKEWCNWLVENVRTKHSHERQLMY
ncbi:MAG: hydrogenase nickel incorporation protein HypB [Ignavibacteria bacterium]|nr:hydrogenase nickel incorporation protein HypB [Ignavibacteria bacterium]